LVLELIAHSFSALHCNVSCAFQQLLKLQDAVYNAWRWRRKEHVLQVCLLGLLTCT